MRYQSPHPIPYQGSKRLLAPVILSFIPEHRFTRMIEPFAGSAAVTLAAANKKRFSKYLIADLLQPLTDIWKAILEQPENVSADYRRLWNSQSKGDPTKRFNLIRAEFNAKHDPAKLLFLLARCVKNAVRFSGTGQFNQSPDKRRQGMHPDTMDKEIQAAHRLLKGKCQVVWGDFRDVLKSATSGDLVYMDPPYQGVSDTRDRRYIKGVQRSEMVTLLEDLNARHIEFILSYDGKCGDKTYGEPLPPHLGAHRVLLEAGRSSQATLNGKDHVTVESVYLSRGLYSGDTPANLLLKAFVTQGQLFS
jgi:DNA adenine methylase